MKKFLLLIAISILGIVSVEAQNIQLHYDFGSKIYNTKDRNLSSRPMLTTTVEKFHADKWGSTFFFVDMDYKDTGVAGAYWELARELKFWKAPISAHIEYNGGLMVADPKKSVGFSFNNAYLAGATYSYNNADFSKGFSLSAMYKYIQHSKYVNNFQLTGVWYMNFNKGMFTFNGFADFWKEYEANGGYIFLTEPQLWWNLNKMKFADPNFNLSIGTEVEISTNFGGRRGFYCIPTAAVKWTF